jgi:hypothetical protein
VQDDALEALWQSPIGLKYIKNVRDHDSFLAIAENEKLTEEEKQAAWRNLEAPASEHLIEKQRQRIAEQVFLQQQRAQQQRPRVLSAEMMQHYAEQYASLEERLAAGDNLTTQEVVNHSSLKAFFEQYFLLQSNQRSSAEAPSSSSVVSSSHQAPTQNPPASAAEVQKQLQQQQVYQQHLQRQQYHQLVQQQQQQYQQWEQQRLQQQQYNSLDFQQIQQQRQLAAQHVHQLIQPPQSTVLPTSFPTVPITQGQEKSLTMAERLKLQRDYLERKKAPSGGRSLPPSPPPMQFIPVALQPTPPTAPAAASVASTVTPEERSGVEGNNSADDPLADITFVTDMDAPSK